MSADSITVMDGPFYFNNEMFSMDRIDYRIPLNSTEIWTLKDSTMVAHPFHLHDVWFYILDRNGVAPDPTEQGRKDVLLIQPNETVRFIARFDDFADTTTPYMYHCHILMHEDDGMMGQFIVGASDVSAPDCRPQNTINIFPNPASDQLNISVGNMAAMPTTITITNTLGIQMFKSTSNNNVKVNTSGWPAGLYNVVINNNEMHTAANVVIY
jgi:bilirubin oxidase